MPAMITAPYPLRSNVEVSTSYDVRDASDDGAIALVMGSAAETAARCGNRRVRTDRLGAADEIAAAGSNGRLRARGRAARARRRERSRQRRRRGRSRRRPGDMDCRWTVDAAVPGGAVSRRTHRRAGAAVRQHGRQFSGESRRTGIQAAWTERHSARLPALPPSSRSTTCARGPRADRRGRRRLRDVLAGHDRFNAMSV